MKQKKNIKYAHTNTNESTHIEPGPLRQNATQRTVRSAHRSITSRFDHHLAWRFRWWKVNSLVVLKFSCIACYCVKYSTCIWQLSLLHKTKNQSGKCRSIIKPKKKHSASSWSQYGWLEWFVERMTFSLQWKSEGVMDDRYTTLQCTEDWQSASVVNYTTVTDPTIRQPETR